MDQIFDRLGRLLKSFVTPDEDDQPFSEPGRGRSGDPFLDDAMDELDAFLEDDREKAERLRAQRDARARAEEELRAKNRPHSGPPKRLLDAYAALGLSHGADFASVKAAYKRLLKAHHPDRHGHDPAALKKATETSARINDAYRTIETWIEKGRLDD